MVNFAFEVAVFVICSRVFCELTHSDVTKMRCIEKTRSSHQLSLSDASHDRRPHKELLPRLPGDTARVEGRGGSHCIQGGGGEGGYCVLVFGGATVAMGKDC